MEEYSKLETSFPFLLDVHFANFYLRDTEIWLLEPHVMEIRRQKTFNFFRKNNVNDPIGTTLTIFFFSVGYVLLHVPDLLISEVNWMKMDRCLLNLRSSRKVREKKSKSGHCRKFDEFDGGILILDNVKNGVYPFKNRTWLITVNK